MNMSSPRQLSDQALEAEVARLASSERGSTASLVAHLAELYGRRLHERAGFASLFTYCMEVLRLSEHEAYDRMKAAKMARRFPQVLEGLASGDLNLTTIRLLAPHLTRANHEGLFAAARGKRKRQVQELLASRFPRPDVAASVRRLPSRPVPVVAPAVPLPVGTKASEPTAAPAAPLPPQLVRPLAPERYQVTFTTGPRTRELLQMAQDLLRHAVPSGDPGEIVTRALDVLVEDLLKKKFAVTSRPRTEQAPGTPSRHVPAEVKRAVYLRDRGRCVFVGTNGRECGERAFLEFDHHPVPFAAGGPSTVENLQLRCRAHNGYLAKEYFGRRARDGATRPSEESGSRSGTTASLNL
jgi:hypothetical protein